MTRLGLTLTVLWSFFYIGCIEDTQVLVLHPDGSGHYESMVRLNSQMIALLEVFEKVNEAGLFDDIPYGTLLPLSNEAVIRSLVDKVEDVQLLRVEVKHTGEEDQEADISFALQFNDVNAFLASEMGKQRLGLRLHRDEAGNIRVSGKPSFGQLLEGNVAPTAAFDGREMTSEEDATLDPPESVVQEEISGTVGAIIFFVGNLFEQDDALERLFSRPNLTLKIVSPTPIQDINHPGTITGSEAEWHWDARDLLKSGNTELVDIVLSAEGLAFEVNEDLFEMAHSPAQVPDEVQMDETAITAQPPLPPEALAEELTIYPIRVQITQFPPQKDEVRMIPQLIQRGGMSEWISVSFGVTSGGITQGLEQIDTEASTIIQFRDDTGKDLLWNGDVALKPPGLADTFFFGVDTRPSSGLSARNVTLFDNHGPGIFRTDSDYWPDGGLVGEEPNFRYTVLTLDSPKTPAAGAASLLVAGELAIVQIRGRQTETQMLTADADQTFTLGTLSYHWAPGNWQDLQEMGETTARFFQKSHEMLKNNLGEEFHTELMMLSDSERKMRGNLKIEGNEGDLSKIRKVEFFSENNEPIDAHGPIKMTVMGKTRWEYSISSRPTKLVVTSLLGKDRFMFPFEVKVSLHNEH